MDISDLMREGDVPAISPNAGRNREFCWTPADWGRYGEALKRAFPSILFHEELSYKEERGPKPAVRFLDRLDDPSISRRVHVLFPYDGWKPDLVLTTSRFGPPEQFWTWARYLSPSLHFFVKTKDSCVLEDWRGQAADSPVEMWPAQLFYTSYRRLLADERKIEAKAFRLAQKQSVRAVPVFWESLADFREGRFKVSSSGFMVGHGWTSQTVVDWCLSKPQRAIQLFVPPDGSASGCLPVELVPDSAWGDIRKPQWAQRS